MAKVNFYLQKPSDVESYVRLVFNYTGGRLVYYPGERVKSAWWNPSAQRVRKTAPGHAEINAGLDRLEGLVLDTWRRFRNDGLSLPPDRFRAELDIVWKGRGAPREGAKSLFEFWEQLIAERKASPNYATNSVRAYATVMHKLQAFAKATRRRVDFDTVTLDLHGALLAWMGRNGHSPNFIHKVVAVLKVVMAEAADRGLHDNQAFRSRRFTVKTYQPEHVYLDESELARIASVELPGKGRLHRARDLFLLGCYTGLRFSDYSKLRLENLSVFDGVEMLTVQTRKTGKRVTIPIFSEARAVLDRYGGPPEGMTNQKLNQALKEICRIAGIDTPTHVVRIKGGERVETVAPKYELVSTHSARRSWATNEYLRAIRDGRSWRPIMDILGMTREATFFRYVKVSQEQSAVEFARARGG